MSRLLMLMFAACFYTLLAVGQEAVTIDDRNEIRLQERSGRHILTLTDVDARRSTGNDKYVLLQVVVETDGSVISAKPLDGDRAYFTQALREALKWRFEPFERDGQTVRATFTYNALAEPPEKRLRHRPPMPEVGDWDSLRITLRRRPGFCFGECSDYRMVVHGNGTVEYTGKAGVPYCGEWRGSIPLGSVRELVSEFRSAEYFSLYSEYAFGSEDYSTIVTSISFDDKQKKVVDSGGNHIDMPEVVSQLENTIDRLAGPEHWLTRERVEDGASCKPLAGHSPQKTQP